MCRVYGAHFHGTDTCSAYQRRQDDWGSQFRRLAQAIRRWGVVIWQWLRSGASWVKAACKTAH